MEEGAHSKMLTTSIWTQQAFKYPIQVKCIKEQNYYPKLWSSTNRKNNQPI